MNNTPQSIPKKKDPFALPGQQGQRAGRKNPFALPGQAARKDPFAIPPPATGATPEDSTLQQTLTRGDALQAKPALKIATPSGDEKAPGSELLRESSEDLGLDGPLPFPQFPGSVFNTAAAVSTGLAPVDEQGLVDIETAKERVGELVEGYDRQPLEARRATLDIVKNQYRKVIEQARTEGEQARAAKLETELQNIDKLSRDLLSRAQESYERNTDFFTQTYAQIKKGVLGMMLSANGRAIADTERLNIFKKIDETGEIPQEIAESAAGPLNTALGWARQYQQADPAERQRLKAAALEDLARDVADVRELRASIAAIPTSPVAEAALTANSFGEAFELFMQNPGAVASEVAFANLPQMGVTLGAGVVGSLAAGPAGAAAAGGAASGFMEYGNLILEELARRGVDVDNEDALLRAVQNEELMAEVKQAARTGALVVGLFDAAAFGVAGARFIPKGTVNKIADLIGRETLDTALQATAQGLLGGAGAAGSQLARRGEITGAGEILAEFGGEFAFAPLKAFGVRRSIEAMRMRRTKRAIVEFATAEEVLQRLQSERTKATEEGNTEKIQQIDRQAAELKKGLRKLAADQAEPMRRYLGRVEKALRRMERRQGAKALGRGDFKALLAQRDVLRRMLGEAPQAGQEGQTETVELNFEEQDNGTTTQQAQPTGRGNQPGAEQETQTQQTQGGPQGPPPDDDSAGNAGQPRADGGDGVGPYLMEEGTFRGSFREGDESIPAVRVNEVYSEAWENPGKPKKLRAGNYAYRLGNNLFEVQREDDGTWSAHEVNGLVENQDGFGTRKEAVAAAQRQVEVEQAAPQPQQSDSEQQRPVSFLDGPPVTLNVLKNPESAPDMGGAYGQDVEPAGDYVTEQEGDHVPEGWEQATVTLQKPLVVEVTDDTLIEYKRVLSERYEGKTGQELSEAIRADGYDGIITRLPDGSTGEIVLLGDQRSPGAQETPAPDPAPDDGSGGDGPQAPQPEEEGGEIQPNEGEQVPAAERLAQIETEIARFEALDNPTEADNDYLMFLRDQQEALQQSTQAADEGPGEAINPETLRGADLPGEGLRAANRQGGKVYVGSATDIHATIVDKHGLSYERAESGFVTPDGRWLNRNEAADYVRQQNIALQGAENAPPGMLLADQLVPQPQPATPNGAGQAKENAAAQAAAAGAVKAAQEVTGRASNWGVRNRIVTPEKADQIRKQLLAASGQLNMGVDPKAVKLGLQLATFHVEAGVREFADFAKLMIEEAGEQVLPHLRELYRQAIARTGINETEFSDKPEIDRFFLDYHKNGEKVYSVDEAASLVSKSTKLSDAEVKSQLEHQALTNLAKAYLAGSTEVNTVLDFIDAVRERFPGAFDRGRLRSAWSAALSNAEEQRRFWFDHKISETTGLPLHAVTFYHNAALMLRKKIQDSFVGQKKVQEQVKRLRGEDYFTENERLDAYMAEELVRGKVSEQQWKVTSMDNPNSMIRQILQIAADNGLQLGQWTSYYNALKRADQLDRLGATRLAEEMAQKAFEADPNQTDDLQRYLHARHAAEANDFLVGQITERINELQAELEAIPDTPENKQRRAAIKAQITRQRGKVPAAERGSGMTNQEAEQVLQEFEAAGKTGALEQAAQIVYQINEMMLDMREQAGLNPAEELNEFRERFERYVPLNRVLFDPYGNLMEQVGRSTSAGENAAPGTKFKRRKGSDRPVDNILGSVITNFDKLIGDVARNDLMNSLASLYDSEWAQGNEAFGRSVRAGTAEDANIARKIPFRRQNPDGSVEDRVLIFNNASSLVFEALDNYDGRSSDGAVRTFINTLRSFMNYLRFVRTSGSMNFIISNPQRDIGTVMGNMASDFGYGKSLKFAKDIFYNKSRWIDAQRSVWEYLSGQDTPGAAEYSELKALGGTTGFYQLRDRADILKDMRGVERQMEALQMRSGQPARNSWKLAKGGLRSVIRGIEMLNEVAENATRLTAYRMALENGYSKQRAASYALNINTNFNKSGDWGDLFKIGYQFANSAIQGHTRLLRAAKVNPKTFTKTVTGLMMLGAANSSFNDWMNEEAHKRLKATRPWLFHNNLVFLGPDGGVMFKIYLPFGYNVFKAAGDVVYDLSKGTIDEGTAAARLGDALADSFNPFRGSEMFTGGVQGLWLAATPSGLQPATEIALNKSFFGTIYPPFKHALQETLGTPDYQLRYDSVNPYMDYVTRWLAANDVVDISPETIEHMSYFLTGSVGREWADLFTKAINTDEARRDGWTLHTRADGTKVKVLPNEIPVLNRFFNTLDQDRLATSHIWQTVSELSTEAFDMQGEAFQGVLQDLQADYQTILSNEAVTGETLKTLQGAINSFTKTVYKNNAAAEAERYFRAQGWEGEEFAAERANYYERANRRVRAVRIPKLYDAERADFRLRPYAETRSAKVFDESMIQTLEDKMNF